MGYLTDPEMCSLQYKMSFSYDCCRNSCSFATVCFTIDRVTTQRTPKCEENCSDVKVSIFVYLTLTRLSVTSVITPKTAVFFEAVDQLLCYEVLFSLCPDRDALGNIESCCQIDAV